jgi:hypothetical protein
MKKIIQNKFICSRRTVSAAMLLAGLASNLPAHAQFADMLNSFMRASQQQQQQKQVKQEQQQKQQQEKQEANPQKMFGPAKPVPSDLRRDAGDYANQLQVEKLQPLFERLYIEGERNATLNLERIGLAALSINQYEIAEKAFDAAILRIDMIYADNPEAQKAKSLWSSEKVKDYKGEPYERAMAYFYRGLVYAARNDFQNARAMFKQADYQSTVAESEKYSGNFALMPYMAGWASYCDGDKNLAQDYLKNAIAGDPGYSAISIEQPVLVLAETGRAPFKYAAGKHGQLVKWASYKQPAYVVTACGAENANCPFNKVIVGADVNVQATTRGGRPIDAIQDGKAAFKDGANTVASAANFIGKVGMQTAANTGDRSAAGVGLFGLVTGLVAQGVSNATQTQADTREWEQLPGTIWLGTGQKKRDKQNLTIPVDGSNSNVELVRLVNSPSCQLYWGRNIAPLAVMADAGPIEPGSHVRDPAFRQEMKGLFTAPTTQPATAEPLPVPPPTPPAQTSPNTSSLPTSAPDLVATSASAPSAPVETPTTANAKPGAVIAVAAAATGLNTASQADPLLQFGAVTNAAPAIRVIPAVKSSSAPLPATAPAKSQIAANMPPSSTGPPIAQTTPSPSANDLYSSWEINNGIDRELAYQAAKKFIESYPADERYSKVEAWVDIYENKPKSESSTLALPKLSNRSHAAAENSPRSILANNMLKLRENLGWSQEKLAAQSGLKPSFIARIEQERNISLDHLDRIAQALGVPVYKLLMP